MIKNNICIIHKDLVCRTLVIQQTLQCKFCKLFQVNKTILETKIYENKRNNNIS
jgi:hypothetical protein